MNIFYLHPDPKICAEWAVDKHCVKMILEAAQLLSTAHRLLDGVEYVDKTKTGRSVKRWRLTDSRDTTLYSATHVNHPCAVWVRESARNYTWLWSYLNEHCKEYTYRYGKIHKVEESGLLDALKQLPRNVPRLINRTPIPSCMDAKYIISEDAVENYRNYYKIGKAHLHSWKLREAPEWIME
jgi:hypothetical protein